MRRVQKPLILLAMGVLLITAAISLRASSPEIELTLTARDMAFYLGDDHTPNPTLEFGRGQRVRIHFVNEDQGVLHDLALPGLALSTGLVEGDGSRMTLTFRTPRERLSTTYACTPHRAMMSAVLEIR